MARLDDFIDRLFGENGTELHFETGTGAVVRTPQGAIPLLKQPLTTQQIVGAVSKVVPDNVRAKFPSEGVTSFAYAAAAGRVSVKFEMRGDNVKMVIVPEGAVPPAAPAPIGGMGGPARRPPAPNAPPPVVAPAARPVAPPPPGRAPAGSPPPAPPVIAPPPPPPPPVEPPQAEIGEFELGDPRRTMEKLLDLMIERRASDLHLTSGVTPMLRIDGSMRTLHELGRVSPDQMHKLLFSIAPDRNKEEWTKIKDTDFAHENEKARFRVNVFSDRNGIGAVLRIIPSKILTSEDLGLSQAIMDLCHLHKGLVVVTGPTGSGKSTTLAAMVDYINRNRDDHIITIEDPIEFVHPNKKCLINQREVGVNTGSFKHALRAALREDPDIVLVGEMRDLETVAIAIETAETGHLVFGTLHTTTAASTIDRVIDQFPADRQDQIRLMLSESLKGVIAQTLCKKIGGGRVAALEVLICNNAISNLIREGKTFQIPSIMQTNRGSGMVTLNDSLFELVKRKLVEPADAYAKAIAKAEFKTLLERGGFKLEASE